MKVFVYVPDPLYTALNETVLDGQKERFNDSQPGAQQAERQRRGLKLKAAGDGGVLNEPWRVVGSDRDWSAPLDHPARMDARGRLFSDLTNFKDVYAKPAAKKKEI